ncbi:MAG: hypothetical protein JSS20_03925 [Proteobacteria bacterium]|nr:hypothetical protein [Pseudomonadota bacterium]
MRSLKLGLAATAIIFALSATSEAAECHRIGAVGEAVGYDMAHLFATNALKNIMAGKGYVGKGQMRISCKAGSGTTVCHSSQIGCKTATPKSCLGAWLCL